MSINRFYIALALLALTALGSCGSAHDGALAQTPAGPTSAAFQVNVLPDTYSLGGSARAISATVDTSTPAAAGRVLVNINVDHAQGLKSLYLTLKYDPAQYRALAVQPTALMGATGSLLSLYLPTVRGTAEYGQVLVNPASQIGLTGSGVVAQFSFSLEPEVAGRTVSNAGPPVTVESQVTNLAFDGANLTWTYFMQGDYDQNGETNTADLTPIANNFHAANPNGLGQPYPITSVLSQIDGDSSGDIDAADIVQIGKGFRHDMLGGYHVYRSSSPSDYPSGNPPLGAQGPGATELTMAPGMPPLALTDAVNYAARSTERLRFVFAVASPQANDFYWVRPADGTNVLGISSNLSSGTVAGPPTVSSTAPINGETDVAPNVSPSAVFSEVMDPSSITTATFTLQNGPISVTGSVTYAGVTTTFHPDTVLAQNSTYIATITTGARNTAGVGLTSNYSWTFTTGTSLDTTAPTVISTVPATGDTGVTLNTKPTATFSEPMDPVTINTSTFTLLQGATPVSGSVSYAGVTATFAPAAPLLANSAYTATLTTGAMDLAGNALATDYVWTFNTGATLDTTAPTVTLTDPVDGATGIVSDVTPSATFSEPMDPLTLNVTTFTLTQAGIPVAGTVAYANGTATFTPGAKLLANTTYMATITTGAQDLAGNALASDFVWSFTTSFVDLGGAAPFGGFGGGSGMTNQGIFTVVDGDICTTGVPTMITGFHDTHGNIYTETPLNVGLVTGNIYTAPPAPGTAQQFVIASKAAADAQIAYDELSPASMPGGTDPGAGELGGLTLFPGIYKSAGGTFNITGFDLTLDAQGDPTAVWVFQCASALTVGDTSPRNVLLINGARASNVFWYVGSAATINAAGGGTMVGTIMADAGVTFSTAGNVTINVLNGRALGLHASVTLVNTHINVPK